MILSCPSKNMGYLLLCPNLLSCLWGHFRVSLRELLMILVVANKTLGIPADQSNNFITENVILEERTEPIESSHQNQLASLTAQRDRRPGAR